eukprot:COSAG05_NODE_1234_length_5438_cov_60.106574_4_plen_881_part_00
MVYRPHVLHNPRSADPKHRFVMWARAGRVPVHNYVVLSAPTPEGPWAVFNSSATLPSLGHCANTSTLCYLQSDHDLFVDPADGTGYIARNGMILRLRGDFLSVDGSGPVVAVPTPSYGETPCMFAREGRYYMLSGYHCCACKGGSNLWVDVADHPLGPWKFLGDIGLNTSCSSPLIPPNGNSIPLTHSPHSFVTRSQAATVFEVNGSFVLLGNQWVTSARRNTDLFFWHELKFDPSTGHPMQVVWLDEMILPLGRAKTDDDSSDNHVQSTDPPSLKTGDGSELPARASLSIITEPGCSFSASTFSFSLLKNGTLASFAIGHGSSEVPLEYASGGAFIGAATTAGPSAVWHKVTSITCAVDSTKPHTTLLQAQIAHPRGGTLSASVMVEIVGQFVRLSINAFDAEIQQLRFGGLSLAMPRGGNGRCQNGFPMAPCDYLPHATDNMSAVVLMPLSPTVETAVDRTDPHVQRLHASAMRALSLHPPYELIRQNPRASTAVLLWAGAQTDMHGALRMAETVFDIPSPRIGAVRAKDSPAMQQGYFLESWKSVSNLVAAAKTSGLSYVMIEGWETTEGHFAVNEKIFPGGDEGLKAAVGLLHAAGLKVGIHFLSNLISKTDAYVTPIPHPDLAVDAALDLANSIAADSTFIPTVGTPTSSPWLKTDWPAPSSSGLTPGSVDYKFTTSLVRIENELITYRSTNSSGLVECTRGALGSKAAAHESATEVQHLAQMYDFLMPRPGSQLVGEISDRLAHVYNYCELDMVYFDGAEGLAAMGSEQVPIALFEKEFFEKLTRGILIEGSSIAPYTWWLNARANTGDYAFIDPKSYMDVIKRAQCAVHTRNGMNPELGWWGMAAGGVGWTPTFPDEIEYPLRSIAIVHLSIL